MRRRLVALLAVVVAISGVSTPVSGSMGRGAAPPPHVLVGQTPAVVADGAASVRGQVDPAVPLTLTIGLGAHNTAQLDAVIAAASDPASPDYGHYLTPDQYMARFAPTDADVAAVRAWATGAGLRVDAVSPDHLLMTVHAPTGDVERALDVGIDTYHAQGRDFRANNRDATVPAGLDIRAISGLSTAMRFHAALTRVRDTRSGGYYPQDFRSAYNVNPVGDGSGQTIGFTLWGAPLPQSDLDTFAGDTGTPRVVGGQGGANGIDWIPVNGGSVDTTAWDEVALDVEHAHGIAPNSHLKYWLSDCSYDSSGYCAPSDAGLEQAVNLAAHAHDSDPSLRVVSDSWGGTEPAGATDMAFAANIDASLQYAASQGVTFYFSSGDTGYASGTMCDPYNPTPSACSQMLPSYPADSPYAVSVGGTSLVTGPSYSYGAESAWNGSGGGCSVFEPRPAWQTGVGAATCSNRAEPDVSADADPNMGAYVVYDGVSGIVGGTSLAAPLWAGMTADLNRYLVAAGRPPVGFTAPALYALTNNSATYSRDFHDVTSGNNNPFDPSYNQYAQCAGAGWDEVTGWGSPNLANLAADWPGNGSQTTTPNGATDCAFSPSATPSPSATGTSTPSPTATDTNTPTALPTATDTATAVPSPTSTSTPTDTPTNTPTNTPTPSATAMATVTPTAAVTTAASPTRTSAIGVVPPITRQATAAATPSTVRNASRLEGPAIAATIRVPRGAVTEHSVVTVSGQAPPRSLVTIVAALTTTTASAHKVVIYVHASPVGRAGTLSKLSPRVAACHKSMRGCVARTVTERVSRTATLYQMAAQARADRTGHFATGVRLNYHPRATLAATLTVTIRTPRGATTRSARIKVAPPASGRKGKSANFPKG